MKIKIKKHNIKILFSHVRASHAQCHIKTKKKTKEKKSKERKTILK